MTFNELHSKVESQLKKANSLTYHPYTVVIGGFFEYSFRIKMLSYGDSYIEELGNGRWETYYKERGIISRVKFFENEEEACSAFYKENAFYLCEERVRSYMKDRIWTSLRLNRDHMASFCSNQELQQLASSDKHIIIRIDSSVQGLEGLVTLLQQELHYSVDKVLGRWSWREILMDLSWLQGKQVSILHFDFPKMSVLERRIYLSTWFDIDCYWAIDESEASSDNVRRLHIYYGENISANPLLFEIYDPIYAWENKHRILNKLNHLIRRTGIRF